MKRLGFLFIILLAVFAVWYIYFFKPSDEFAEHDLLNEIMQRGYIKVGINTDSKPFGYYDEKGNITGYDAELAGHIAQYLVKDASKVRFVQVTPSNRLIKASTGEVDMVISTVTITPQRLEVVNFSRSYLSAGQALLIRSSSNIQGIQDLAGLTVGVVLGTTAEKNIQRLVPTAYIHGFKTYNEAYLALKSGKIAALTSDDTILNGYALRDKDVKLLYRRYSNEPYGIAFKKGNSTNKLKLELDYAIKDLQRRGTLLAMYKKWGLGG